jgi:hypothetical protein
MTLTPVSSPPKGEACNRHIDPDFTSLRYVAKLRAGNVRAVTNLFHVEYLWYKRQNFFVI